MLGGDAVLCLLLHLDASLVDGVAHARYQR